MHLNRGEQSQTFDSYGKASGYYPRTVGRPVRSYTQDPRALAMKYWKRAKIETIGFQRTYVPRTDGLMENDLTDDPACLWFGSIKAKENKVKADGAEGQESCRR